MPRLFQKPRRALQDTATAEDGFRLDDLADTRTVFGSYVTAACGISNDPPDVGALVDLTVCNVTQYRCNPIDNSPVFDLEITYDYEVRYNPAAVFDRVLPFVEESILESLAAAMNLKRCAGFFSNRRLSGSRFLQEDFSPAQQDRFIGVNINPRDTRDERFAACLLDETYQETADSACLPIQGGLTVSLGLTAEEQEVLAALPEEDREEIRMAVLNFVSGSMMNDVYIVPGNIEKVIFVGDRQAIEEAKANTKGEDGDDGLSGTGKGLLSAGILIFLLLILFGIMLLRKRSRKDVDDSSNIKNANLMPGIAVLPEDDDEDNWHSRRTGATDLEVVPGSLAFTDSLALKAQIIAEDEESVAASDKTANLSYSGVTAPSGSPLNSFVNEDGEVLHAEYFTTDQINVISEAPSQDSLFDVGDQVADTVSEGNSDFSPREALQMA